MNSLKSTTCSLIIGVFFMLPVLLIVVLATRIITVLKPLGSKIAQIFDLHSIFGQASVLIVSILLFLGICILCGYFIQKGIFKKWSNSIEEQLFIYFPSLQVLKYRMIENKANVINEFWQAILLEEEEHFNIAFITEKSDLFLTLYIPDAPKIDAGEVRYVKRENINYYPISMHDAMLALYNFGKGLDIKKIIENSNSENLE